MELIKQVISVDVSQNELVLTYGRIDVQLNEELKVHEVLGNSNAGFKQFEKWVKSHINKDVLLEVVMEATGVYHEKFAMWLYKKRFNVVIVMPNKIANYTKTLNLKTITDKTSSEAICKFGLKHKLEYWHPADPIYKKLQQLTRERSQIIDERTTVKNQLHAESKEAFPNKGSIERSKKRIKFLDKQVSEVEMSIKELVKSDQPLEKRVTRIQTIPGVGLITSAIILSETNGFEHIKNKRQLTSFAGLDVVQKQSGTSIKGKTKISKKGNVHLRKAMYFPGLSAVKCNEPWRDFHSRLVGKSGIKMKGYVAIQRKILELSYILDKTEQNFDNQKVRAQQNVKP